MFAGGLKSVSNARSIARIIENPSPSNVTKLIKIAQGAKGISPDLTRIAWNLQNILKTKGGGRVIGASRFAEKAPKLEGKAERAAHALLTADKINAGVAGEILADLVQKWIREGVLKIEGLYVERKA